MVTLALVSWERPGAPLLTEAAAADGAAALHVVVATTRVNHARPVAPPRPGDDRALAGR